LRISRKTLKNRSRSPLSFQDLNRRFIKKYKLAVVGGEGYLNGAAADFAVFDIGLRVVYTQIENHRNFFSAVGAAKGFFHQKA
jgi:hypothetical protein